MLENNEIFIRVEDGERYVLKTHQYTKDEPPMVEDLIKEKECEQENNNV